jgi:hypothetical protein
MAKNKRRERPRRADEPKAEKSVFVSPFKDLKRMLKDRPTAKGAAEGIRATVAPTTPESPLTALDDDTIFRQTAYAVSATQAQRG